MEFRAFQNIKLQIVLGFGLLLFLLVVLAAVSISASLTGQGRFGDYRSTARSSILLADMQEDILSARMLVMKYRALRSDGALEGVQGEIASMIEEAEMLRGLISADMSAQVQEIESAAQDYTDSFAEVMALYKARDEVVHDRLDVVGPQMRKNLTEIMSTAYADGDPTAAFYAGRAQEHLMLARYYGKAFLLQNDEGSRQRALDELQIARDEILTLQDKLQNPGRARLAAQALTMLDGYTADFGEVAGIIDRRNDILRNRLDTLGPQILASIDALVDQSVDRQNTVGPQINDGFNTQTWIISVLCLAGLVLGLGAALLMARAILRPIDGVTGTLETLASGDLGPELADSGRSDAIGRMIKASSTLRDTVTKSFMQAQMIEQIPLPIMMADPNDDFRISYMNPTMSKLAGDLSDHIKTPMDQMIGTSIDAFHANPGHQRRILSDPSNLPFKARIPFAGRRFSLKVSAIRDGSGAYVGSMVVWDDVTEREQLAELVGASVNEVAGAVEQAQSYVAGLSDAAANTQHQSSTVSSAAEQASTNVHSVAASAEEMSASIGEITSQVTQSSTMASEANTIAVNTQRKAEQLNDNSQRIGDIVKMISDIAEQTNLLALNATIEAARAGEAGRGFAVVASEVKNLAEQTGKATIDIGEQIEAMQGVTNATVNDIASLTQHIDKIASMLGAVAAATEEQGAATQEISRNVTEAARGTQDVSETIGLVRDASVETDRSAHDLKNITDDLSGTSKALGEAAERFLENIRAA